ncbi:MAG TPA: DUF3300 domain-containing protein [Rariglobus sp.]|jgi:hypothetical protein|nr:DUF3300 domain-containing protein [Rariglobus sp.]
MKIITPALLGLCFVFALHAQDSAPSAVGPDGAAPVSSQRTPETLDTLLGPIALYPDPLVALILPASTNPSDVVLASRYLDAKNDPAATDSQTWSESVKALVHYPEVLRWMNENLEWTQALGQAFLDQPADVMNAVQRLRVRAKASGALVDTPQQHVLTENAQIVIVPAQPDIVYVPVYDPAVVYIQRSVWFDGPFITFAFGYPIGPWFIYDCDWGQRTVWVISRPANWRSQPQYWHYTDHRQQRLPGRPWRPPVYTHPRPSHPVYMHAPTPRPIGSTGNTSATPHQSQRPRENTVAPSAAIPANTSRPPRVSHEHEKPAQPSTPAPVYPPAHSSASPVLKPAVVAPPAFTHPTRPANQDPIDRSHHPHVTPPPVHIPPAYPPPSPSSEVDQRKKSQGF